MGLWLGLVLQRHKVRFGVWVGVRIRVRVGVGVRMVGGEKGWVFLHFSLILPNSPGISFHQVRMSLEKDHIPTLYYS